MIDYEKKYQQFTSGLNLIPDISQDYPYCNGFEKCIISMRKQGWTYEEIQSKLGMPPKKQIRQVLLKWTPELIDNSLKKKPSNVSVYEAELYSMVHRVGEITFNVFNDDWTFHIENNQLKYRDQTGDWLFSDWDINTQSEILDEIKQQWI